MTRAVEARKLKVSVKGRTIVEGFTVELEAGRLHALTGPTGSGKSTILKTLAGIIPGLYPSYRVEGEAWVYGVEPWRAREEGLVAYIPQDPTAYLLGSTVAEELELVGCGSGCTYARGLEGLLERRVYELSDGQLYRLLIATALASRAKLLLVDEPTSHLDSWTLPGILGLLEGYCREYGATAIIVDHRVKLLENHVASIVRLDSPNSDRDTVAPAPATRPETRGVGSGYSVVAEDLWFSYSRTLVLKGASLWARPGELHTVTGRNGSGKTTLVKILAGLLKPSRGRLRVSKPVFLVPQTPVYWFSQDTVRGEAELYARLWGFNDSVDSVLEAFHLSRLENQNPVTLSVGEARLLSLALAYISRASVLLLDEPSLGLDSRGKRLLVEALEEHLSRGATVIVATHDPDLARLGGARYLLEEGRLVALE